VTFKLLYGLTPPKLSTPPEKVRSLAEAQMARVLALGVDAVVLYDLQDESSRVPEARPFPFAKTIDPIDYARDAFAALKTPKIVYRCVGNYSEERLARDLADMGRGPTVFVGAASAKQATAMSVDQAYALRRKHNPALVLGGVAIPERHLVKRDEHLRVARKVREGCSFFITQCVYNVQAAKDFLSDYYFHCCNEETATVPIIFTLTPCGSQKTLAFMRWLGISVPRWLENELTHSPSILDHSLRACERIFAELQDFANEKRIPIGFNVESIALRKEEIDASVALATTIREQLLRGLGSR
jgi:hypothetical protein